jgi:hypothetical protein
MKVTVDKVSDMVGFKLGADIVTEWAAECKTKIFGDFHILR